MNLEILTPDSNLFKGEAQHVQVPGIDGLFGVLDNHAPMISSLGKGTIKIKSNGQPEILEESRSSKGSDGDITFDVNGGTIEVLNNKVVILAE